MKRTIVKKMVIFFVVCISSILLLDASVKAATLTEGDYQYEILEDGTAKITKYTGKAVTLTIPDKLGGKDVTQIADCAFEVRVEVSPGYYEDASTVTTVHFPESLAYIGNWNFYQLTSIHIPKNVTYIASRAFGTDHVRSITVDEENVVYDSRNNCNAIIWEGVDEYTGMKKVELVRACNNSIIPDTVTHIGADAFFDYTNKSIEIPNGVKEIGYCAFSGSGLTELDLPSSVTRIGGCAFMNCDGLTKVILPDSVKVIYNWAFMDCNNLVSMTIPTSVEEIGEDAFTDCSQSMIIYAKEGSYAEQWAKENGFNVNGIANDPAKKGSILTAADAKCKVKVTSSDKKNPTVQYKGTTNKKATTVKVPDTITVDGVKYKVTSIGNKSLYGNKKVTKVVVGKNVKTIGKEAFKNCTKLKTVEIKSTTLNKIGANAFSGDKKLTKITLKTTKLTKKSIGKNVLKGTNKKLVIKVPKKKVSTYKKYFNNKGNKTVRVKK